MKYADADSRPGLYYVTARNGSGGKVVPLIGPFVQRSPGKEAHARALAQVDAARAHAIRHYDGGGYASFALYGTVRMCPFMSNPPVGRFGRDRITDAR